ncbi:MAG: heterodisulfide reductase-related iron-sulfur binding cluster, partial [Actinomycetales bacterium]
TIPDGVDSACCGTPFASKGMTEAHQVMRERVRDWLWSATEGGRLPVVVDAASCTEGLTGLLADIEGSHGTQIVVVDAISFVRDTVLARLPEPARMPSIAVHPTCSTSRLGITPALLDLAARIADQVYVPDGWGCCGFAGDRGMLHPELTASATAGQAAEVARLDAAAHASANRTCEIGMTRATGKPYAHILEHLVAAVRGDA